MQNKIAALLFAVGTVSALAVPVTKRDTTSLPDVLGLENEVTYLANDFVTQEGPYAREVLTTIQYELSQLAPQVLSPSDYTCEAESYEAITTLSQAINTLNETSIYLNIIAFEDPYQSTDQASINSAFCNANNSIDSLEQYTYAVGTTSETVDVTPLIAETYTQIALKALTSSLKTNSNYQTSLNYSQIAYNNTQTAITCFAKSAGATGPYSCPMDQVQPANSSETAYEYAAYIFDEILPSTYAEVEKGSEGIDGFCNITAYMNAINDFLKA